MKDPEHEDYDDDEYRFYPDSKANKFSIDWVAWQQWLEDAIKDIVQENENTWSVNPSKSPVSDSTPQDTSKQTYFMYLGSNHYNEAIWKKEYFLCDDINKMWKNHISSNAAHFLKQPEYYKGLHTILN
jgi:hypothetical protein